MSQGRRKALCAMLIGTAILGAGVLAAGGTLRKHVPPNSNLNRISGMANAESGSSKVRLLMWNAAARTVLTTEPVPLPSSGADRLAWLRPLIGFGPETIASAIGRNYEPELDRLEVGRYIDQCHNVTWDLLITHGFLGTLAFFALIGAGFSTALIRLTGTRFTTGNAVALAGIVGGMTLLGAIGAVTIKGASMLGLGAGGGFVAGILVTLPYATTLPRRAEPGPLSDRRRPIIAGLAAALVAHFVEAQFGVPTVSGTLYSWIVLGLLCVESRNQPEPETGDPSQGGHLAWGLTGALALVSIGFSFCVFHGAQQGWQGSLRHAMSPMAIGLAVCVLPALYMLSPYRWARRHGADASGEFRSVVAEIVPGILALILVVTMLSLPMARLPNTVPHSDGDLLMVAKALGNIGFVVFSLLLLLVLTMGAALTRERPAAERPHPAWTAGGTLFLGLVLWIPAQQVSFRPVQADMCQKQGQVLLTQGHPHAASGMFLRAMALAPDEELYAEATAQAYARIAFDSTSEAEAIPAIREAIKYFECAVTLNPSRPDNYANLSRAFAWWAGVAKETKVRRETAQSSDSYMAQALRLAPRQHELWEERAELNMGALSRPDLAESYLEKALELAPDSARAHELRGEFLAKAAPHAKAPERRIGLQRGAVEHFEAAVRSGKLPNPGHAYGALARLHLDLGNLEKAGENAERAMAAAKDDEGRRLAESLRKAVQDARQNR